MVCVTEIAIILLLFRLVLQNVHLIPTLLGVDMGLMLPYYTSNIMFYLSALLGVDMDRVLHGVEK